MSDHSCHQSDCHQTCVLSCEGPQGPQGDIGPQGPQGPQGIPALSPTYEYASLMSYNNPEVNYSSSSYNPVFYNLSQSIQSSNDIILPPTSFGDILMKGGSTYFIIWNIEGSSVNGSGVYYQMILNSQTTPNPATQWINNSGTATVSFIYRAELDSTLRFQLKAQENTNFLLRGAFLSVIKIKNND